MSGGSAARSTTELDKRSQESGLGPVASSFLGVALTLGAIFVGLSVLSYRNGGGFFGVGRNSWNECRSGPCLVHFRRLEDSLNRRSAPCEDFYRFACGSWRPRVAGAQTAFRDLVAVAHMDAIRYLGAAHNVNMSLPRGGILAKDPVPSPRNRAERAYRVCLYSHVSEVPLLHQFLANRSLSWPERTAAAAKPLDVLLDLDINWNLGLWFSVHVTAGRHGRRLLRVGPGIVSGAWKKALDTAVLRGVYNARVRRFYDIMRTNNFVPISDKDLEELRHDEYAVAGALSESANGGQREMAFPLKQMPRLATPGLNASLWATLLNRHLKTQHRVTENDRVLATNVNLLQAVDALLSSLPVDRVLHQLAWTLVQLLGWMADPVLPGRPAVTHLVESRHADCFWAAHRAFGIAFLSSYINTRYPTAIRSAVDGIITSVTQTTIDLFLKTAWIDFESREVAVDKLRRVSTTLWPPDAQMNASETDALLEHFPEPRDDLFRYWLDALVARRALIGRRDLEGAFPSEDVQSQRALFRYHYYANELVVSLQALQSPLFVQGGGRAVNLAGLGAQYAEALARAFDPRGVLLEGRGSASGLWWGRESYREYERRTTACATTAPPVNGSGGSLETFEGVAAIEIAYAAFNATRSMSDRARWWKRRDFLGLSEDQAFFVSFCQAYCAREPSQRQRLSCTLPLKNHRAFAAAFQCPASSPMNPQTRCSFFESDPATTKASSPRLHTQSPTGRRNSGDEAVTLAKTPFGGNMF